MALAFDQKPPTAMSEPAKVHLESIKNSEYATLIGRNNCGKSFILKSMAMELGLISSYLGPARYNNFNLLGTYSPQSNRKEQKFN